MKNRYYILFILLLWGSTSCEDYLETAPLDNLAPANYYNTADQLDRGLNSVYDILGASQVYRRTDLFGWDADVAYMNRATLTAGPWNYNFSYSDNYISNFWRFLYIGVYRANLLIANVDRNTNISQEFRRLAL